MRELKNDEFVKVIGLAVYVVAGVALVASVAQSFAQSDAPRFKSPAVVRAMVAYDRAAANYAQALEQAIAQAERGGDADEIAKLQEALDSVGKPAPDFQVHAIRYGTPEKMVDVRTGPRIGPDGIAMRVHPPGLGGDPAPGQYKTVHLDVSIRGQRLLLVIPERAAIADFTIRLLDR